MNYSRIEWVDNLKGLLMILVVSGHIFRGYNPGDLFYPQTLFISTFHMPLFFLISGFLSVDISNKKVNVYVRRKCRTLLLPFVSFVLLGTIINVDYTFISYFTTPTKHDLWFLYNLFIYSILLIVICKCSVKCESFLNKLMLRGNYGVLVIVLSILVTGALLLLNMILPTNLNNLFSVKPLLLYWPYFVLGYLINKFEFSFPDWILGLFVTFFIIVWWADIGYDYRNEAIFQLSRLCAVIFLFNCFKYNSVNIPFLSKFGKESLSIYLLHHFFTVGISAYVISICGTVPILDTIMVLLFAIAISFLCIVIKRIVETSRLLNLILFGKR